MRDLREPEECDGITRAAVDAKEWEIACGAENCGAFLADASWYDMQMAMILNSSDESAAREAMAHLPPVRFRRFRMHALFPPSWSRGDDGVWQAQAASPVVTHKRHGTGDADVFKQRYIRGRLRQAELSQEAMPPAKVRCPVCGTVQIIERRVRSGAPALVPDEKAS
ncbi:MAG: hypothetical protein R3C29_14715 [Dehalococcoidia bacterium]|nr:hypothetical protein [Dehalococcoidia bacterium]MCA9845475.1 hypothetical protein [Dehalococcoidia bacterium]